MNSTVKILSLFGLCCIAACNNAATTHPGYAASQLVSAARGGAVTVTAAQSAALAGTTIQIPPAALSKDTTITIRAGAPIQLADGFVSAGAVAEFGPDGLVFANAATITLPYQLAAGAAESDLSVFGVETNGSVVVVGNADLTINAAARTVAFEAAGFTRFGAASGRASTLCPPGTTLCGCCGSGKCLPSGVACPLVCPANGCGGGGGGTCCPAGEYFCGCGSTGSCIPDDQNCPIACPVSAPPSTFPNPMCCPAGEYFCGCLGQGKCIPDDQVCPATCPVCDSTDPNALPCPPNEICLNGKCVPVFVADGGSPVCDPSTPCASGETCCGCCGKGICLPAGEACPIACPQDLCPPPPPQCDPANASTGCPSGDTCCPGCCGLPGFCVPAGQTCPALMCPVCAPPPDAGITQGCDPTSTGAPVCPKGDTCCPGCCGSTGICVPAGQTCPLLDCPVCAPPPDAGVIQSCQPSSTGAPSCPTGDVCCPGCCGSPGFCVPAGQVCPALLCPACPPPTDAGVNPPCDPSGASGSICPKGETCCGCGSAGHCLPAGEVCPLMCPSK